MSVSPFKCRSLFCLILPITLSFACGSSVSTDLLAVVEQAKHDTGQINPAKELVITDLSVVNDSRTNFSDRHSNAWSFGQLMTNMAGGGNASRFIISWLKLWETDQNVNGFTVPARPVIRGEIINPWLRASGCADGDDNCQLDLSKAPFRLLAITNRMDLRAPGNAGQGRFVFGALDGAGQPLQFTVILEYALLGSDSAQILNWAERWHALANRNFGTPYNKDLEAITEDFAGRNAAPGRVNGSAILQVRTNEVHLSLRDPNRVGNPLWQLREFHLSQDTGLLEQVVVAQTPDLSFNNTPQLASFLLDNADAIRSGNYDIDPSMLGGSADMPGLPAQGPTDLVWRAPGVPDDLRQIFASGACNGCHLSETGTRFTMIKPRQRQAAAAIASVLSGSLISERIADLQSVLATGGTDPGKKPKHSH